MRAGDSATSRAVAIAESAAKVQRMGATLIQMRRATLQDLRNEYLDHTWTELRERLRHEVKESSVDQIIQKSWVDPLPHTRLSYPCGVGPVTMMG